ncbi:MAG: cyanophycinase [Candidatus Obscuribacterales bacterium]|nr:cyanophycinase [Candidatus Obscuribacterales bacterium]
MSARSFKPGLSGGQPALFISVLILSREGRLVRRGSLVATSGGKPFACCVGTGSGTVQTHLPVSPKSRLKEISSTKASPTFTGESTMTSTSISRRGFLIAAAGLVLLLFATQIIVHAEDSPMPTPAPVECKGTLYIVGGAADTSLKRFVELAGGAKAKIAILPHSSSVPIEAADEVANIFLSLGVKETVAIQPTGKQELPNDITAVWMTGGDQNRLMRLADKALLDAVRDFLNNGGVVGGTSAGAAVVVPKMIAGGMDDGFPRGGALRMGDGLGLLPGYVVDTHVKQRERHDRLMAALALVDGVKGMGLDEDTAVEIHKGKAKVFGAGCVRLYERAPGFSSNLATAKDQEKTSVRQVLYSIIPEGEEFDL